MNEPENLQPEQVSLVVEIDKIECEKTQGMGTMFNVVDVVVTKPNTDSQINFVTGEVTNGSDSQPLDLDKTQDLTPTKELWGINSTNVPFDGPYTVNVEATGQTPIHGNDSDTPTCS